MWKMANTGSAFRPLVVSGGLAFAITLISQTPQTFASDAALAQDPSQLAIFRANEVAAIKGGCADMPTAKVQMPEEPPTLSALKEHAPYRVSADQEGEALQLAREHESALSLGMRAGFNRVMWCQQREILSYSLILDQLFDFNSLLFDAGDGFRYEPGIATEEHGLQAIKETGQHAASADARYVLVSQPNIVTGPRSWRQYLLVDLSPLAPEPSEARPTKAQKPLWDGWVAEGWRVGVKQALDTTDRLWEMLDNDYVGMVTFRRMMLERMVVPPLTTMEAHGTTGDANHLTVNAVEVKTARPARFQGDSSKWIPLPFVTNPPTEGPKP